MQDRSDSTRISRRDFLGTAAAVGAGAILGGASRAVGAEAAETATATMPTRAFGKTGVNVPILSLGGIFNTIDNQLLLRQALQMGVTYWDTAESYGGGKSEKGFGKYLGANSDDRKKIFLVTKSTTGDSAGRTKALEGSLDRLKTDYVDLFFIHDVNNPDRLNDEAKVWAEQMKKAGKIKFFGFSSHDNMWACLQKAAQVGWVDGAMITYNFRIMYHPKLKAAVDAAHKAGIGLTAMKIHGAKIDPKEQQEEVALYKELLTKGYTPQQASLKAVWANEQIACICSKMPSMTILSANVAAALDKTKLSAADHATLQRIAAATASSYCAGCSEVCSPAVGGQVPVCDVMRYLMYYNAYGETREARELFAALPADVRGRLTQIDYSVAEVRCPQGIPIAERMKLAEELLA